MSTTTTETITLDDCECEERSGSTCYKHESGAYVEIIHDDSPSHPLDDVEGIALAFREGDHYNGTADDYPRYPEIDCPTCEGTGQSPDRFELLKLAPYAHVVIGAGTEGAMLALADLYAEDRVFVEPGECARCRATGRVDADLETYFRVDRGARAIYEFRTGNHGEASAVMYVTDDDWTDPAGAAVAWADEYQKWADGDVWGIEYGGPGIETESCWGFIGREYAEEAALNEFLLPTIKGGHMDAQFGVKYPGTILFAESEYGGERMILRADFGEAGYGPWFYEGVHDWLCNQDTEPGMLYRFTGSYRLLKTGTHRFTGTIDPVGIAQ